MGAHTNRILGTALVASGLFMLLSELGLTPLGWLWPLILLLIGGAILYGYYRERDDSGKVFSGVTVVLIALFFVLVQMDALLIGRHWPFFLLAPGIGLLVMAQIDEQRRDAMVPGWILAGVAAVGYFFSLGIFTWLLGLVFGLLGLVLKVVVPIGLIGLGGWLLFSQRHNVDRASAFPEKVEPAPAGPAPEVDEDYHDDAEEFGAAADLPPPPDQEEAEDVEFEEDPDGGPPPHRPASD